MQKLSKRIGMFVVFTLSLSFQSTFALSRFQQNPCPVKFSGQVESMKDLEAPFFKFKKSEVEITVHEKFKGSIGDKEIIILPKSKAQELAKGSVLTVSMRNGFICEIGV